MVPNPFRKPGARERKSSEKIVKNKINVSDKRIKELEELRAKVQATSSEKGRVFHVLVANITPPVSDHADPHGPSDSGEKISPTEKSDGGKAKNLNDDDTVPLVSSSMPSRQTSIVEKLMWDPGLDVQEVDLPENGWKLFKERLGIKAKFRPDAIILVMSGGEELPDMAKTVIATSMLQGMPVLPFATPECSKHVEEEVYAYSGCTWPVFRDKEKLAEYAINELPILVRVVEAVVSDVFEHVKGYKNINPFKHGFKRAAVALLPFAVTLVNFVGVVRLCGRMMIKTGMAGDFESKKAVAAIGGLTAGKVILFDELGDMYQYAIFATVLADLAAQTTLEAAAQSLTLFDVAMLGSTAFVTGAVSAIGAYLTRPVLVDSIAKFLSSLQLISLINPEMRRPPPDHTPTDNSMSEDERIHLLEAPIPGEIAEQDDSTEQAPDTHPTSTTLGTPNPASTTTHPHAPGPLCPYFPAPGSTYPAIPGNTYPPVPESTLPLTPQSPYPSVSGSAYPPVSSNTYPPPPRGAYQPPPGSPSMSLDPPVEPPVEPPVPQNPYPHPHSHPPTLYPHVIPPVPITSYPPPPASGTPGSLYPFIDPPGTGSPYPPAPAPGNSDSPGPGSSHPSAPGSSNPPAHENPHQPVPGSSLSRLTSPVAGVKNFFRKSS